MGPEWSLIEEAHVPKKRKIVIPENVKKNIEKERVINGTYGPSVYWNVETNAEFVVLSKEELRKSNYDSIKATRISAEKKEGYVTYKIRPPKGLNEKIASKFIPGMRVFYLAYEDMLREKDDPAQTQSVYLLTEPQLFKLLPKEELDGKEETMESSVLNSPGFLPPIWRLEILCFLFEVLL